MRFRRRRPFRSRRVLGRRRPVRRSRRAGVRRGRRLLKIGYRM